MKQFHKLTAWVLTLAMLMTFIPSFTIGVNATENTDYTGYYKIGNAGQLSWFACLVVGDTSQSSITEAVPNANAVLTADIDITILAERFGKTWSGIGMADIPFTGIFDGNGYTIKGLTIDSTLTTPTVATIPVTTTQQGLFGVIGAGGIVRDVILEGTASVSDGMKLGAVCSENNGTIENVLSMMTVTGGDNPSAFVHTNNGTITNCYTNQSGTATGAALVSSQQLEDGSVTYELGSAFGQTINVDTQPVHYDGTNRVYKTGDSYSNTEATSTYTVTVNNSIENGTVIADVSEAEEGDTVTLTVTPEQGYVIDNVSYSDGTNIVEITATDDVYSFTMPASDVTVTATFVEVHSVYMSRYAGYTVSRTADTVLPVTHGSSYSFTVEITSGYEKTAEFAVKAGNKEDAAEDLTALTPDENGVYTINNITSDIKISVVGVSPYKPDSIDDFKVGGNAPLKLVCEADDAHSITAPYFDSAYITIGEINPESRLCEITFNVAKYMEDKLPGHRAAGNMPDNITMWLKWDVDASKWEYTTTRELKVTCAPETYAVRFNIGSNGTVTADKTEASEGEIVTLTVIPNEGYKLNTIIARQSGTNVDISDDYTFTMPAGDVTVTATFKRAEHTITFNANGGECETVSSKTVSCKLASLPEATRTGYAFNGWFDAQSGGNKITTNTEFTTSTTVYAQWTALTPKITGIAVDETSSAYDAETNTFTVAKDKPFVAFLTGDNFAYIDNEFLEKNSFGFIPSVDDSENALGNSLYVLKDAGFVTVDATANTITLTFDYDAIKAFITEYGSFEGICYGDIENIKEENIKPVNIALAKYDPTYTEPTVRTGLVYDGKKQELLIPGTAEGGTMKYFIGGMQASEAVPTGTSAGEYRVTCIIAGDETHNNIVVGTYTVTIAKKTIDTAIILTAPVKNTAPQTEFTGDGYTASVAWSPEVTDKFGYKTEYTATITITPDENHTVTGVGANGYTVEGAKTVTNDENSNVVIVGYEKTGSRPSSGGSASSNITTITTKNEDGSKTVVTENKVTGTKTELTTNTDGSSVTVEIKKDGTTTNVEKDKYGNTTTTILKPDGTSTTTEKNKDGTKVTTQTTADGETSAEIEAKGETEVVIPVPDAEDVTKVVVTDKDGKESEVGFEVIDGAIAVTVPGTSIVSVQTGHICYAKDFADVDLDAWYHLNIDYVLEKGLFKGTSETTFAPNSKLTRAMLVTVLYRAEGEPATNESSPFADVDMSSYYGNAVSWAKQNGIVNGVSETEFAPDDNITREQIAAIMHRYAAFKGYDVSAEENTNILSYEDFDSISGYAVISMQWAVGSGLIKGKSDSTLNPLDNATRAEVAAILHRFIEANK